MADLSNLSAFVKGKDLKTGDIMEFRDAGEIMTVDFKNGKPPQNVFQVTVSVNSGSNKKFTMNKTSLNILSQNWGNDSVKWVGKKALVTFIQGLVFGKPGEILALQPKDGATSVTLDDGIPNFEEIL